MNVAMMSQQSVKPIRLVFTVIFLFIFAAFSSHAMASEVDQINAVIQAAGGKWVAGETSASRLAPEQRRMLLGTIKPDIATGLQTSRRVLAAPRVAADLPPTFDWRNYNGNNYVTSVKDQGFNCGACWAFSTAAALESQMLITENLKLNLSEETLLACDHKAGDCTGGYTDLASSYIRDKGLPPEACLPYKDSTHISACTVKTGHAGCDYYTYKEYQISDWEYLVSDSQLESPNVSALKNAVYAYGPIVVVMNVYSDYYSYFGGIFQHLDPTSPFEGLHGVLIVGYDDNDQCFIVKNSWGSGWGENGYFRIAYSEVTRQTSDVIRGRPDPNALANDFGCYPIAYHRYGSLAVAINPANAVTAGAQWNVDNGGWMDNGAVVSDLQVGVHTVGFKTVPGFPTPSQQSVTVKFNQTTTITAVYSETLTVTITPSAAVSAGAQWQVDGGTWNNSGTTVYLGSGQHTVTFKGITSWTKPEDQTITIASAQTATATGNYTPDPSVADFIADKTQGLSPLTVNFTDKSTGVLTNWSWNFGDGKKSTAQNPSHIYKKAGTYSAVLTVNGLGGTSTKTQTINVYKVPKANFKATPKKGVSPLTVSFTDKSSGTITEWLWDFGDQQTSTDRNPSHTYNTPGTYTVTLIAANPGGSSTKVLSNYITVYAPANAGFTAAPTTGAAPALIVFSDSSAGTISKWKWDFGDGKTSLKQNPTHSYSKAGTYSVNLTVSGKGGTSTATQSNLITIN
jgi:PKD repeat protein/C1A family cysteine protease